VPAAGGKRNGEDRQEIAARLGYLSRILAVSGLLPRKLGHFGNSVMLICRKSEKMPNYVDYFGDRSAKRLFSLDFLGQATTSELPLAAG
jgi:hypothetical protein